MAASQRQDLTEIYARPGFKIRRAHQIAQSVFMDECGALDLTPTQYGVLVVLARHPGIDQISLARLLGLDRSTTGMVVAALEARRLVRKSVDRLDRRRRTLRPTPDAARLLAEAQPAVRRTQDRLLAPFTAAERQLFLGLLDTFIAANSPGTRVPLVPEPAAAR